MDSNLPEELKETTIISEIVRLSTPVRSTSAPAPIVTQARSKSWSPSKLVHT